VPGRLIAFDALTLKELWRDDANDGFMKFTPPTVAGGKVFRPVYDNIAQTHDSFDHLIVYGLRTAPTSATPSTPVTPAKGTQSRAISAIWRAARHEEPDGPPPAGQPGERVHGDHLDIFMTSHDPQNATVLSTNWEAVCPSPAHARRGWRGWFPVVKPPTHAADPPVEEPLHASADTPVTALLSPSDPSHLDLFTVGVDGRVMSTFFEDKGGWQEDLKSHDWRDRGGWQGWFPVVNDATRAAPGQPVTAVWAASNPHHLDLFMTGTDGRVMTTYFEGNGPWQPWFTI
jgi:hypothetical protein